MNWRNNSKVESLSEWLQIATKGLVPASKERIAQEIETHYSEALASHLAQGESGPVAEANALAELGDPRVAGKSFRKKHLTEKEGKRLGKAQKWAGNIRSLFFYYFLVAFYYFYIVILTDTFVKWPKLDLVIFVLTFSLAGIISPTIAFLIMKRRWFGRSISIYSLVESLGCAAFSLTLALTMETFVRFIYLIPFFWMMGGFSWLRIWNKLRKEGEAGNGAPRPV